MTIPVDKFPQNSVADYYKTVRKKLRDGDVLICSGSGIFSSMIQQATDQKDKLVPSRFKMPV